MRYVINNNYYTLKISICTYSNHYNHYIIQPQFFLHALVLITLTLTKQSSKAVPVRT